jgi:hypothetical protein
MNLFAWWWKHEGSALDDAGLLHSRPVKHRDLTAQEVQLLGLEGNDHVVPFSEGYRTNPQAERARQWIKDYEHDKALQAIEWSPGDVEDLAAIARGE